MPREWINRSTWELDWFFVSYQMLQDRLGVLLVLSLRPELNISSIYLFSISMISMDSMPSLPFLREALQAHVVVVKHKILLRIPMMIRKMIRGEKCSMIIGQSCQSYLHSMTFSWKKNCSPKEIQTTRKPQLIKGCRGWRRYIKFILLRENCSTTLLMMKMFEKLIHTLLALMCILVSSDSSPRFSPCNVIWYFSDFCRILENRVTAKILARITNTRRITEYQPRRRTERVRVPMSKRRLVTSNGKYFRNCRTIFANLWITVSLISSLLILSSFCVLSVSLLAALTSLW